MNVLRNKMDSKERGMRFFLIAAAAVSIAGCKPSTEANNTAAIEAPKAEQPPAKPPYTEADWKRDFSSSFVTFKSETNGDGVTTYSACFEPNGEKCALVLSGMKDGFRKVDHLTPAATAWHGWLMKYPKGGVTASFVDLRAVAVHCDEVVVVLNPVLHAKNWLFMNKIAFMADGDVVYEQSAADLQSVQRDTDDGKIWEKWSFRLEPEHYASLEKFAAAESKVIRLSGNKGYITMQADSVKVFTEDFPTVMKAVRVLNESLTKGGGPTCTPSSA